MPRRKQKRRITMIHSNSMATFYAHVNKKEQAIGSCGNVGIADSFCVMLQRLGFKIEIFELPEAEK